MRTGIEKQQKLVQLYGAREAREVKPISHEDLTAIASKLVGESRTLAAEPALRLTINHLHSAAGHMAGVDVSFSGELEEALWVMPETESEWSICGCTFIFPSSGTFLFVAQFIPWSSDSSAKIAMTSAWGEVTATTEKGMNGSVSAVWTHELSSGRRNMETYFTCPGGMPVGIASFEVRRIY